MAVELGVGYLSIVPETSKIAPGIKAALGGVDAQASKSGSSAGSKLASALGVTLKAGALTAGVAAGGVLGTALVKGMGRLTAIEDAQTKLSGLGNSASKVGKIMDSALASVKGTAFGLDEAATVAAQVVAAGVKPGRQLTDVLSTVADTATIAGASMSDMGLIFGSVAARGKLQGDDMLQLMSRGVPVLQLIAKETGKTSAEVSEMVSKGQIDFQTFADAMQQGMGGAALKSGDTFRGALANMNAALGRFGAAALEPLFDRSKGVFGGITDAIDDATDRVKPLAAAFGGWIDDVAPKLQHFGASVAAAFQEFRQSDLVRESMQRLGGVFTTLMDTARDIGPAVSDIGRSLAEAAASTGVSTWKLLLSALEAIAEIANATLVPVLRTVADLMKSNQGVVNAFAMGFLAFKTVPSIMTRVSSALAPIGATAQAAKAGVSSFASALKDSWRWAGQAGENVGVFSRTATIAGGNIKAAFGSIKSAVGGVVNALGGLTGIGIAGVTALLVGNASSASSAKAAQDALTQAVADGARAQRTMFDALAATNGALDDQSLAAGADVVKSSLAEIVTLGQRGHSTTENLGRVIDNLTGNIFGANDAWEEQYDHVSAMEGQYKELQSVMKSMKIDLNDVYRITAEGGPEFDTLLRNLEATGGNGKKVAGQLRAAHNEISGIQDAARALGPTAAAVAAGFKTIGDEAATADEKSSALKKTLDALAGGAISLFEAESEVADAHQQVAEGANAAKDATKGYGDELLTADGRLKGSTENGKAFGDAILDARDSLADFVGAGGDLNEKLPQIMEGLYQWGESLGLTREQVDQVAAAMGLVPDTLTIAAQVQGKGQVMADLGDVATQLDNLKPGEPRVVQVSALTAEAQTALEGIGFKVERLPNGLIKVTADTPEAESKLTTLIGIVAAIPNGKRIDVSAPGAQGVINGLETIGIKVHQDNEKRIVIDDNSPETIAKLEALNIKTTTLADGTVVVTDNVPDVKGRLNSLNGIQTSSTHTVNIREQLLNPVVNGAWNPGFATGGAIFGPGTGTSDDILARLSNGEHVWTAAEVEAVGGQDAMYRMRAAARAGTLPAFADGGAVGRALAAARSKEGLPYVWGGTGPDGFDCSGFVGWVQQILMGVGQLEAAGKRLYTTYSLIGGATAGLVPGLDPNSAFNVGVSQEHMAATLDGQNIESGGGSVPSSSGVGPGRAGAADAQFPYKFHLPNNLIAGGYEAGSGAASSLTDPIWSEADEKSLQDARAALDKAQQARASLAADASQEVRDHADLEVARAEKALGEIESKKQGKTGVQALTAPAAPPLSGAMDDDAISLRQAELAVTEAQLQRDKTYADVSATSLDKEKADMSVYQAQNALKAAQEKAAEGAQGVDGLSAKGGLKGVLQSFASKAAGIAYDSIWKFLGIDEPRYLSIDLPDPVKPKPGQPANPIDAILAGVPTVFPDSDIARQLPTSAADFPEWLKKHGIPLHDEGGWLEPGLTLNLTRKPEAVLNPQQLDALYRVADAGMSQGAPGRPVEIHTHLTTNDQRGAFREKRRQEELALMQYGGGM